VISGGKLIWLSMRSWVVRSDGVICRPATAESIRGVDRSGLEATSVILTESPKDSVRYMYEIFTSRGYSIVNEENSVVSINGFIKPAELFEVIVKGENVHLEDYVGHTEIHEWNHLDLMTAAHTDYFPKSLLQKSMQHFIDSSITLPVRIPRVLFSQASWIIHYVMNTWGTHLRVDVDNRTFPTELIISEEGDKECRVLSVTRYQDSDLLLILAEKDDWYLVCDGLIVA